VIAVKQPADDSMPTCCGLAEIMRELKLELKISMSSNKFFHKLNEYPACIDMERGAGHDKNFIMKRCESIKSIISTTLREGIQKAEYGRCHAKIYGNSKFDNSAGTKTGHENITTSVTANHSLINQSEKLVILSVKKNRAMCHGTPEKINLIYASTA
jgi:hypothetical protein